MVPQLIWKHVKTSNCANVHNCIDANSQHCLSPQRIHSWWSVRHDLAEDNAGSVVIKVCTGEALGRGARKSSGLQKHSGDTKLEIRRWSKDGGRGSREREFSCLRDWINGPRQHLVRIWETPDSQLRHVFCMDSHRPSFLPWAPLGFTLHGLGRNDWLEVFQNEIILLSANHGESMSLVSTVAERTSSGFGSACQRVILVDCKETKKGHTQNNNMKRKIIFKNLFAYILDTYTTNVKCIPIFKYLASPKHKAEKVKSSYQIQELQLSCAIYRSTHNSFSCKHLRSTCHLPSPHKGSGFTVLNKQHSLVSKACHLKDLNFKT